MSTPSKSSAPPPDLTVLPIIILSGPSGSGKTTIVNRLTSDSRVKIIKAISATTRPMRKGELDGEDYYFLTPAEFQSRRERDEFVECAEVHSSGYWYGTLKSELVRAYKEGGWALLEIDVQGALQVLQQSPQAVTIFLRTVSDTDYETRLRSRGTESEEIIQRRLQTMRNELKYADRYRYQVINDNLDRAIREIEAILVEWEKSQHA
ncbi:MAG: guanylate kinase [Planctomycetota bacterium]|nr:guanylate kinase [Planctomycetota bacterium]MDA1214237.1 guanylate kinase [Planctomycetota bacterium]